MCEAFFYLKNLNLLVLKYFLAYLGSSVKTTIIQIIFVIVSVIHTTKSRNQSGENTFSVEKRPFLVTQT